MTREKEIKAFLILVMVSVFCLPVIAGNVSSPPLQSKPGAKRIASKPGRLASGSGEVSANRGLRNFHKIDELLYRGGMPNEEGLENLLKLGVRTIIDFRNETEEVKDEKKVAARLGIKHINIPTGNAPPTIGMVSKFLYELEQARRADQGPVFIHCRAGCDRTGVYLFYWRVLREGWKPEIAYFEALRNGFQIHKLKLFGNQRIMRVKSDAPAILDAAQKR